MRRSLRPMVAVAALLVAMLTFLVAMPDAPAQNFDEIVRELENNGYYIESGADGTRTGFEDLVRQGDSSGQRWYFVSMADSIDGRFADELRDAVAPRGNVLVYFLDGEFVNVQLASDESESVETQALAPFDGDWDEPEDFMSDVVRRFSELTGATSTTGSSTGSGSDTSNTSDGGFPWLLLVIPAVVVGGIWFMSSRGRKKKQESDLETAQKIRAELQSELDELANDVLVLSGPTDLSDKKNAVEYYREATDTYLDIADDLPDIEKLEDADLKELSALGARVSHARWQMDAAEAILDGEPIPEKPKVPPPPAPKPAPSRPRPERQLPQRQARPRVPYSPSRRRSGGGLLDILIAGAGMAASTRRGRGGGGIFGGSSRGRPRTQSRSGGMFGGGRGRTAAQPRRGGGVFGSGSRSSRSSNSRRSTSRSSSRRSSKRNSTSKRRIR